MTEQEGFIEAITDRDERIKNMAEIYDALTAERDHWKDQHKECTRLLGEALQEATDMAAERDALKDAARLALDALSEYGNPYNWDEDFHGIRRKWQEPKSNTPSAYNGFELAQPAITALKAVL